MTVEQLRLMAACNHWANTRLLQAAATLSVEERERDLRGSFGSLHGTLIHILWGERHEEAYAAYLRGLTQAELDVPRAVDDNPCTLGMLVQHTLNHSTHHRGQVTLLLRQLGHEPPSTDYRCFLTEARAETAAQ